MLLSALRFLLTFFFCSFYHRCALDAELGKYVSDAYPKGVHSVYCTSGKDNEPGSDFEFVVVIAATRHSPQNFWYVKLTQKNNNIYFT